MIIMRRLYNNTRLVRHLTQGSIINNCVAHHYNCDVWGLIITPRCDLSHDDKVDDVHYLPVVNFTDFFDVDGKKYLYRKSHEKLYGKFKKQCLKYNFPIKGVDEDAYIKMAQQKISNKSDRNSFIDCVKNLFSCEKGDEGFNNHINSENEKRNLVQNLLEDKLPFFYLIEDWEPQRKKAKVILLRELKRISYSTAQKIGNGIEKGALNAEDELDLNIRNNDLYQVCTEIRSPYMEHIMQRFSYNFCRVGVNDRNILDMGIE